jgi:hypothetical protein
MERIKEERKLKKGTGRKKRKIFQQKKARHEHELSSHFGRVGEQTYLGINLTV